MEEEEGRGHLLGNADTVAPVQPDGGATRPIPRPLHDLLYIALLQDTIIRSDKLAQQGRNFTVVQRLQHVPMQLCFTITDCNATRCHACGRHAEGCHAHSSCALHLSSSASLKDLLLKSVLSSI